LEANATYLLLCLITVRTLMLLPNGFFCSVLLVVKFRKQRKRMEEKKFHGAWLKDQKAIPLLVLL